MKKKNLINKYPLNEPPEYSYDHIHTHTSTHTQQTLDSMQSFFCKKTRKDTQQS